MALCSLSRAKFTGLKNTVNIYLTALTVVSIARGDLRTKDDASHGKESRVMIDKRCCQLHSAMELLSLADSDVISPEEFERELWVLSKGHQRSGRKYESGKLGIYGTRVLREPGRPKPIAIAKHACPRSTEVVVPTNALIQHGPVTMVEESLQQGQRVVPSTAGAELERSLIELALIRSADNCPHRTSVAESA